MSRRGHVRRIESAGADHLNALGVNVRLLQKRTKQLHGIFAAGNENSVYGVTLTLDRDDLVAQILDDGENGGDASTGVGRICDTCDDGATDAGDGFFKTRLDQFAVSVVGDERDVAALALVCGLADDAINFGAGQKAQQMRSGTGNLAVVGKRNHRYIFAARGGCDGTD